MAKVVIVFGVFLFLGCATPPKPMKASSYLISTKRSMTRVMADIARGLKKEGYKMRTVNLKLGILASEWRPFEVERLDGPNTYAQQKLSVLFERGSLKVRIHYECAKGPAASDAEFLTPDLGEEFYEALEFGPCFENDQDAFVTIDERTNWTMRLIKKAAQSPRRNRATRN